MTGLSPSNSLDVHAGGQGPGPVTDENAPATPGHITGLLLIAVLLYIATVT
jgi:hypothetical protein